MNRAPEGPDGLRVYNRDEKPYYADKTKRHAYHFDDGWASIMIERPVTLPVQRNNVIAYNDDIFAWAYLDQDDELIRYEAYAVGYSDRGEPTTLEFVIEEGAFALKHLPEVEAIWRAAAGRPLEADEWAALHKAFADEEASLKRTCRPRWTRRLRALGYDVIAGR